MIVLVLISARLEITWYNIPSGQNMNSFLKNIAVVVKVYCYNISMVLFNVRCDCHEYGQPVETTLNHQQSINNFHVK